MINTSLSSQQVEFPPDTRRVLVEELEVTPVPFENTNSSKNSNSSKEEKKKRNRKN